MKVQWKHAIHLNTQQLLYEQSDFSMQWSSGHHPNCSWIRFLKHFVIVSISSRWWMWSDVFRTSSFVHLFAGKSYLFQLGTLNQWAPPKHLVSIEARREQKELLASLSKAIRKSDIIGVRALVLYPGCIFDAGWHKVLIAAHWLKVVVYHISMAFIFAFEVVQDFSHQPYHWQNPGKSLSIKQVLEAASLLKAAKRKGCIQSQDFKLCKSTLQGACFVSFMFHQCNNKVTYSYIFTESLRWF